MNEAAARDVLLVRAYETTAFAPWTAADRAWAGRVAAETVGHDAPADVFVAQRAHAALQRLGPMAPALARWRGLPAWRSQWVGWCIGIGFVVGAVANHIGSSQRINLLAPPIWAVIAWNLAVYLWLLWQALFASGSAGGLRTAVSRWWRRRQLRRLDAARGDSGDAAAGAAFVADWVRHSLPLTTQRAALCLHLGAAALALGLVAGLYVRGLVLDYRVGWESTFLQADTVHRLLSTLLAPATLLSGIALPDVAGVQALQVPGGVAASAAPWIHLYAVELALLVIVPRLALAAWAAVRARRLSAHFPLSLDAAYFQRLRPPRPGAQRQIELWPYARTPDAAALQGAQAMFAHVFGDATTVAVQPTVAYGDEDAWQPQPSDGATAVALFDIGATPEIESQGRFVQRLAAAHGAAPLMLVDEAGFAQRFGAQRLEQRRAAWLGLAEQLGCTALAVDLQQPDLERAVDVLSLPAVTTA